MSSHLKEKKTFQQLQSMTPHNRPPRDQALAEKQKVT